MRIVAALAARLLAGGGDESVGIDCSDPTSPSRLPAFTNVRDSQRAENDQVGAHFAVAAQLGGQIVAAATRADVTAQKAVDGFIGGVANEGAAVVAHCNSADEAGLVEFRVDFVHVRAAGGTPHAANHPPRERFGFDGYQLAGAANLVAEITVGNQHARKLTARLGADKFASVIDLGHCGCSKTLIAKR